MTNFRYLDGDFVDGQKTYRNLFKRGKADERAPRVSSSAVSESSGTRSDPTLWGRHATGANDLTVTTSSSSPLDGEYSYLISGTVSANSAGTVFIETPVFQIPSILLGKAVDVSAFVGGLTTQGWDVCVVRYDSSYAFQEKISVSGFASGATPPSGLLPMNTAELSAFFLSKTTSTDYYSLRFRKLSGSDNLKIDAVKVSSQGNTGTSAVTDWQSYTPTITPGAGTVTGVFDFARWRRVGDSLQLQIQYSGTQSVATAFSWTFSLPTGINIVLDAETVAFSSRRTAAVSVTGGTVSQASIAPASATSISLTPTLGGGSFLSGSTYGVQLEFTQRIVNASSNITSLAAPVVEYVSNSNSTNTASDTTSFAYGLIGSFIPNGTTGTEYVRQVRFQTPYQAGDQVILEVDRNSGGKYWYAASSTFPVDRQGTSGYGIDTSDLTDNGLHIRFAPQGGQGTGATYGATGFGWNGLNTWRWRVVKISRGGQNVGPVNARNIVGDVSGKTVPQGLIGELLAPATQTFSVSVPSTGAATSLNTLSLTAGVWLVQGTVSVPLGTIASPQYASIALSTNGVSFSAADIRESLVQSSAFANASANVCMQTQRYLNVATTTTVTLVGRTGATSGSSTWTDNNGRSIQAVRIA